MATQLVEFRPGKWIKVVDGHIVGRATPEEVAAWQQAGRAQLPAPADLELDIDLSPKPATGPAHALDISTRPAFERRGRSSALPAEPRRPEREAQGSPPAAGKEAPQPTTRAGAPPSRPAAARKSKAVPREAPAEAAARGDAAAAPVRRSPSSSVAAAGSPARQAPPAQAAGADPQPAALEPEPLSTSLAPQGPSYWWVWNARSQPVGEFLAEWTARYRHKFGREATLILCHADDLAAVAACGYNAEVSPLLQPGHFYLSHGQGR